MLIGRPAANTRGGTMPIAVEIKTYRKHVERPVLAEERRQELLRGGRDWRVSTDHVWVTRELIYRSSCREAALLADVLRADAAEHNADVVVRIVEILKGRAPRPRQPSLPLQVREGAS
jgi:hypothetical protein